MKNYLISTFIPVLFLCIALVSPTQAQNWEKYYLKIETAYEVGDYQSAQKALNKAKKKANKKLGENSNTMATLLIKEGKINIGLGLLNEAEPVLSKAVVINTAINQENKTQYGFIYKETAEVMVLLGNYNTAHRYHKEAISAFTSTGELDQISGELDVLEAAVLSGKGFYNKAVTLVEKQTPYFQGKIASANKKVADSHKKDFAELLILKSNSLRKMGDFLRSDSAFIYTNKWIENNLSKSDILYAQSLLFHARLLQENGLSISAQADLFKSAYVQGSRKYLPSHWVNMEINESLISAFYAVGADNKLKVVKDEYEKTLSKSFPKNSIYTLNKEMLELKFLINDQKLSGVENRLISLEGNPLLPKNHQKRIDILELTNTIALLGGKHKNTESYQKSIAKIKLEIYGIDAPEYHLTQIKLANYYVDYADKFTEVREIYETSFQKIVEPEITPGHTQYMDIMYHLATYFEETDQYTKASETLNKALVAARKKYDNKDIEYGKALGRIAGLQINIGQYDRAEKNLADAMAIFKSVKSTVADAYQSVAMITEARLMIIKGDFDAAEENMIKSDELKKKSAITIESSNVDYQDDLAEIYINIGKLTEADAILAKSLKSKSDEFGRQSRQLNTALVLSSNLKLIRGEYSEAENIARTANSITTGLFGEFSSKTVPSMIALSRVYITIGDYDKAQSLLRKAIDIQKRQFGSDHVDVGKSLAQLALVKYYKNDPHLEINDLFREAESIIGNKLGKNNPTYATLLKDMAIAYIAQNRYNEAFSYLDQSGSIWSKRVSKRSNINAAVVEELKGDIYYRQANYSKAENQYEDSKKKFVKFFNDAHPNYIKVQSKLAKTYFMQGDFKKSQDQIENVLNRYKVFIQDYFPSLSEREKAKFWNTIKIDYEFYNTLIVSKNRNDKYIGELYNNALLTKALLLNSSIKVRQRIMNSEDDKLKQLYAQWIEKKELLTVALSMSMDQLTETGMNPTKLSQDVELLEKELSLKSELFGQNVDKKSVTWQNVKSVLKENEVAIEMVRFRKFDQNFTEEINYALLYITGDKKSTPKMILLENGVELETKYLKYYRNAIRFKIKDNQSYDSFWAPIIAEIGTSGKMFISPDGVYNQINLEAIPAKEEGKYVLDDSNIVLVSNTKDLYLNSLKTTPVSEGKQVAMMIGNPVFYVETTAGVPKPSSGITRETTEVISQLPGTKKEIDELNDFLNRKGWEIEQFTDLEATEQMIKQTNSPKIFHVATHGFFQAETKTVNAELNETYMYENPLLKSGLLLTGAGDILNSTKHNYNIENGILTAYEAMNLNLDKTDLVVLSACETGLGELEAGEGVYGLQRAFLVAGAKSVIMSLFKVSDEATQQLMVKFYRKWIETGDKRQAFIDAKKEIRNEYRDPIYWGPFIMIGLD